ncbi:hypothetical protein AB0Y14_08235 [Rothia sp. HC945]|uniref:hypothetical protein n=1 Tax=Rothia sp. HC945 TaxID=3171170 RepID=UPI003F27466A
MDRTAVIAVVGTCEPERRLHAQKIASETGFEVITAERLAIAMDPIREAMALIPWAQADGVVVEYPIQAPILDVIGSLADPEEPTRLVDVVCVLDATHFFSELSRTDRVEHLQVHHGMPFQAVTARSLFAAQHIEYCSTALVVNGRNLPSEDDSLMVSVIGELSPWPRSSGTAITASGCTMSSPNPARSMDPWPPTRSSCGTRDSVSARDGSPT